MKNKNSLFGCRKSICFFFALMAFMVAYTACSDDRKVLPEETGSSNPELPNPEKKGSANLRTLVAIDNPGFENGWTDWSDTDPSAISGDAHTGAQSAKITGSGGRFEQSVTLTAHTDYTLSSYVLGDGTIGIQYGSADDSNGGSYGSWTNVAVSFNSGSSTSAVIYGAYNGGTGRFDDFVLESDDSVGTAGQLTVVSVSASDDDGNIPENTLDGDFSTRWSAEGEQYITYDLGSSQTVGSIKVAWHQGDQRIADFKIRTGDSTSSLTTIYEGLSSGTTTGFETYDFTDVMARYVRITGFGNTVNDWNSITEVEIYGTDGGGDGGGGDNGGGDTTGYPSALLDLGIWELTLPIPEEDDPDNPKDIYQPELDTYEHSTYFHLNAAGDAVVFRAHAGGTTTSGSSYPRSELREMEDGYSGSSPKASWSTTSGTHTMFIEQAITHLPDIKRHVVAGQIHDSSDDVIVFRLEDQKLFIDINGNDGPVLTSSYVLGTVFTVKFVASNGEIKCYYNGTLKYTYTISTSGCYFKAGCYTQSNTSKGDDADAYGEVEIYDLWVTHN